MLGWMDDEALRRTLTDRPGDVLERGRGGVLAQGRHLRPRPVGPRVRLDCDGDALLVEVDQVGAACHTGDRTCFDAARCRSSSSPSERGDAGRGRPQSLAEPAAPQHALVAPTSRGATWPDLAAFRALAPDRRVIPVARRAAGRRRDAGRALPQARRRRRPARSCSSPPSRAASGRATRSSARAAGHADRASDGEARWLGEPPAGRARPGRPARGAARHRRRAAHPAPARPAAADRRAGRLPRLRRRAPLGDAARQRPRRPRACPSSRCCSPPTSPCSTTPTAPCCWSRTRSTTTTPTSASTRRGRRRRAGSTAMTAELPRRPPARSPSPAASPSRARRGSAPSARTSRRRSTGQGGDPRRRGVPDRGLASASRCRLPADALDVYRVLRATNPSPYMYLLGFRPAGATSTSSAPARRRWSRSTDGAGDDAPDRRHPPAGRDARGGRAAGRGAARRPEGAGRARHARRPRPQRPRPGLRARARSRSSTS